LISQWLALRMGSWIGVLGLFLKHIRCTQVGREAQGGRILGVKARTSKRRYVTSINSIQRLIRQGPSRQMARRASVQFPSSLASSTMTNAPPLSSDFATFKESFTPTTSNGNYPFDSPSNHLTATAPQNGSKLGVQPPPLTRMLSDSAMMPSSTSPPAHGANSLSSSTGTHKAHLQPSPNVMPADSSASVPSQASGPSDQDKSKAKDAANIAAKSFRVTLEDPCWKVLPAALKKYKINDDWKMYALFICFGNTGKLYLSLGNVS